MTTCLRLNVTTQQLQVATNERLSALTILQRKRNLEKTSIGVSEQTSIGAEEVPCRLPFTWPEVKAGRWPPSAADFTPIAVSRFSPARTTLTAAIQLVSRGSTHMLHS
ncbi:hypothetical protein E2C01_094599 [Portunus trituberculatus]|uniref:Uncharacterized protein n=1 Tax=Portunus trituberculatus TaxID=210409 RepID=A0A5B7JQV8_PORTR|nr:hypothetical protein [Portunus trituberculatus]